MRVNAAEDNNMITNTTHSVLVPEAVACWKVGLSGTIVGNEVAWGARVAWVELVGSNRVLVFFKTSTGSTNMMAVVVDEMY